MASVKNREDYMCKKHEKPLDMFCRHHQKCICHLCALDDHKHHNTVPIEEESKEKKVKVSETQERVKLKIQDRRGKIKKIKGFVERNKKTKQENTDVMGILKKLMDNIEQKQANLQREAERQGEKFIKDLQQDIIKLKRRNTELEQISNTEDHLHLLQNYSSLCTPPPTNNWTDVNIQPYLSLTNLRGSLSQLQDCVDKEMKKVVSMELKKIQQYAVDVILDPDTAHNYLILSDDGKQVIYGNRRKKILDNPERFNYFLCVLGKEGFSSGRFYYEVQVKETTEWKLGVTRESSNRKWVINVTPDDGYWCLCLKHNTEYQAMDSSPAPLYLKHAPQKVGVFVDYEEGLVSFYDVENESHIYSFTGQTFSEKLYPIFSPCDNNKGRNSASLKIC